MTAIKRATPLTHRFCNKLTCGWQCSQAVSHRTLTLEIPLSGRNGLLREIIKVSRQNVAAGNSRVFLLGTACWELHLLIFPGVPLSFRPQGALRSRGRATIGISGNCRAASAQLCGPQPCVLFSSPLITATASLELAESFS